jgi:colicin import membrane protein
VNEARREAKTELTSLADSVRKPLTDWETEESERIKECSDTIQRIKSAMNVYIEDTSETVRARGKEIYDIALDPERYGDMFAQAESAKAATVASLRAALTRLEKEEADRAELARLQQAEADRLAAEAEQRAAYEKRQREAEEARIAEERRIEAERIEAERIEKAKQEAAARAKREAEESAEAARVAEQRRIDAEREEQQRAHQAELAAERQRAQEAGQREAERVAVEKREAEQRAEREANQAHRTSVKTAAKNALIATGATDDLATKIVLAILAGEIPSVRMEF